MYIAEMMALPVGSRVVFQYEQDERGTVISTGKGGVVIRWDDMVIPTDKHDIESESHSAWACNLFVLEGQE